MSEEQDNYTNETRVRFLAASVLEKMTREYIQQHTINGLYKGDVQYLDKYRELQNYLRSE